MSRRDRACTNVLKAVVAYLFKDKEIGFYFYCFGAGCPHCLYARRITIRFARVGGGGGVTWIIGWR